MNEGIETMPELNDAFQYNNQRLKLQQALIIGLSLTLGFLLIACPLSAIAVHQRLIPPPTFAVRLGPFEIAAPCPSRGFICDDSTPFYSLWRCIEQPDGSIRCHQLFFAYLKPVSHR